jgi:hypothetical protein
MSRSSKNTEVSAEKTLSHKRFLSRVNRSAVLEVPSNNGKKTKTHSNSSSRIKKIQISLNSRNFLPEAESVGEEGTAQHIRSPIVKRGKSSSQSMDILHPIPVEISTKKSYQEKITALTVENTGLKQQVGFYKEQLKVYQKTISDMSTKYENAKGENLEMEEKITQILIENRKILEENEKLINMLRFLESGQGSFANKEFIQEALEAKILSIDQDRDEKAEKYKKILNKLISTLQEFINMQEWVLSLVTSPYPKQELNESEENLKNLVERLQVEIIYYQSQLSSEKVVEKSYCTSLSSSVLYSPQVSPTKTMRFTNLQEFLSPPHNSLVNIGF